MPIINIGSKLDSKGFKQAETALDKLNKSGKNISRTLGLAFGGAVMLRYVKNAGKAFAQDDKAAAALGRTLENLGLAFGSNIGTVNGFISRLEKQTGVLDDELRPAMDRFLRATGDVAKSQELLNLALDISAGTGKSVTQVSQSLQKAYLGQTQAIGRLGVGLSKAELTSSSFEEIQARLSVLFAGQASVAANTYAGQLDKLQVAANNAKETIGKGFVDALILVSGSNTINPVISGIDKIAESIADLTRETAKFIAISKDLFTSFDLFAPEGGYGQSRFKGMGNIAMSVSSQDTQKADLAARKKAAAAAAAAAKKLLATQKMTTKLTQDNLKLTKAAAIFDIKKIQIAAALKGNLSDEDRARLLLMQAIEDENIALIEKYTKLLTEAQKKAKELQETLSAVKGISFGDPFAGFRDGAGLAKLSIEQLFGGFSKSAAAAGTSIDALVAKVSAMTGVTLTNPVAMTSFAQGIGAGLPTAEAISGARYAGQAANTYNIEINAGIGSDPNAIAEAIDNYVRGAVDRGTLAAR